MDVRPVTLDLTMTCIIICPDNATEKYHFIFGICGRVDWKKCVYFEVPLVLKQKGTGMVSHHTFGRTRTFGQSVGHWKRHAVSGRTID